VRRRQKNVMRNFRKAETEKKHSDNIVSSLFPDTVRERLYGYGQSRTNEPTDEGKTSSKAAMRSFLSGTTQASVFGSEPIADFFPSCTVIFIDIANFTAWCSEREPSQVFVLLENIYHAFDQLAEQLGIFKVETIGDSYVAVCGLPTPRIDHAAVMTRFAQMCIDKMKILVRDLEVTLGPSTGELQARCGLHSGAVTAGVLRGSKARFQLFGDTVNTAARMESSGCPSRIHASQQTVNLLNVANLGSWITPREELVSVKGKGTLQTFWLSPCKQNRSPLSTSSLVPNQGTLASDEILWDARKQRLIEWNVEVLLELLTRVVQRRKAGCTEVKPMKGKRDCSLGNSITAKNWGLGNKEKRLVIDEMTTIISLPSFDPKAHEEPQHIDLPGIVRDQLREYVSTIAHSYRDVPFHNFEHASHVIMSATKLMRRIMAPEGVHEHVSHQEGSIDETKSRQNQARRIHEMTYGMSSDPLMQFSVVFSALIHDVDHTGLTNKELIEMKAPVALVYREKCVAEQNSVDVAWRLLMEGDYNELRACIYGSDAEKGRFRELIVDAVLATDIADRELGAVRKN
jgi:class 3 adenylate cyclase